MEALMRKNKMLVVADESGNILAALWPGIQTEGAPSYTGFNLSADQVAYEVEIPAEFHESRSHSLLPPNDGWASSSAEARWVRMTCAPPLANPFGRAGAKA
jgi:hypothetical protein